MKNIVVFSGAGLSAESGIPTFRDSNGLWHNHRVEDVGVRGARKWFIYTGALRGRSVSFTRIL